MAGRALQIAWLLPVTTVGVSAYATDYLTAEQAQKALFPESEQFVASPIKLSGEQQDQVKKLAGVRQRKNELPAWRAMKGGKLLGWFIVDEVIGKHEYITYGTALSSDGKVIGIEIMSYRETHGGQVREAGWRQRFSGKTLNDPFKLNVDVPNISGATLSCRNVLDGVKRLLAVQKIALPDEQVKEQPK